MKVGDIVVCEGSGDPNFDGHKFEITQVVPVSSQDKVETVPGHDHGDAYNSRDLDTGREVGWRGFHVGTILKPAQADKKPRK